MSSDSSQKSNKGLTIVVGLLLICLLPESLVNGNPIGKDTTTAATVPHAVVKLVDDLDESSGILPHSLLNEALLPMIANTIKTNDDDHRPISKSTFSSKTDISDDHNRFVKLIRSKRSPYPPGFVAWTWSEPCFCPPGQYFSCRCYYSNNASDSSESKFRKRRSRSKKLKKSGKD